MTIDVTEMENWEVKAAQLAIPDPDFRLEIDTVLQQVIKEFEGDTDPIDEDEALSSDTETEDEEGGGGPPLDLPETGTFCVHPHGP